MNIIHNPHDHFFRSAMTNLKVAKEFFQQHLPKPLQSKLDLNTLELQPGTYINEALEDSASDILYKVNYRNKSEWAYLYILVDHKSTVDYLLPFQLWQYVFSAWGEIIKKDGNKSRNKSYRLPLIVPLIFYNGPEKYTGSRDIRELIAAPKELIESVFLGPIQLIDLHDIQDEELRDKQRAGIMQLCMKHAYEREILNFIDRLLELIKILWYTGEVKLAIDSLTYSLSLARTTDLECLIKTLKAELREDNAMGTVLDYLIDQHKSELVQSAMQQGESTLIIHQLKQKFETVPERYLRRIEHANQKDLLKWAGRILEKGSLEEVFEE